MSTTHALTPDRLTRRVFNPIVMWLNRRGWSPHGAQTLVVKGRSSGQPRYAPVNPLSHEGRTYLVAPRGHVQWTHNLRAVGGGELRLGRKTRTFTAVEVADQEKPEVLHAYLRRWKEVEGYFKPVGLGRDSSLSELRDGAEHFPVFALTFHESAPERS